MIKKVILTGTTYEVGDFMGEWPIIYIDRDDGILEIAVGDLETGRIKDQHSFALRDGDFIKYENDTVETFKFGDHEDGDDL